MARRLQIRRGILNEPSDVENECAAAWKSGPKVTHDHLTFRLSPLACRSFRSYKAVPADAINSNPDDNLDGRNIVLEQATKC